MSTEDDYNRKQYEYGAITSAHLTELGREWQRNHGLTVDGLIGSDTIKSLNMAVDGRPKFNLATWPMRMLEDGRRPLITSAYWTRNPGRAAPDRRHYGVDMLYRYVAGDPEMKIGDGGRDRNFWVPEGSVAVAAAPGLVHDAVFVGNSRTGWRAWIDHGSYSTGYFHLSELFVKPWQRVGVGDPIGVIGDNPSDVDVRHLHFEVYYGDLRGYPRGSMDPEIFLKEADVLPFQR